MKTSLLRNCALVGVGIVFIFGASLARADDPKPKRAASAETDDNNSFTPAKSSRSGRNRPSVDGRRATSAPGDTVGGASGRETRVPTGSHLPKTYERKSYVSNLDPTTIVIDQNDIRMKNSDSVSDVLRQVPGVTIRH